MDTPSGKFPKHAVMLADGCVKAFKPFVLPRVRPLKMRLVFGHQHTVANLFARSHTQGAVVFDSTIR